MSGMHLVGGLLLSLLLAAPEPATAGGGGDDEQMLRAAGVSPDGPGLLAFFRRLTPSEESRKRTEALIRQLGDDSFARREQASQALIKMGVVARPLLEQARKNNDLEVRRRVSDCLARIESNSQLPVILAAARGLARTRPEDAVTVLLAYLPTADNVEVVHAVHTALTANAMRDGSIDPALKAALSAPASAQRLAAGVALCRVQPPVEREAVLNLVRTDADATVRVTVGVALAESGSKEAVPVLIDLIGTLPDVQAGPAEELLYRLAGENSPRLPAERKPGWRGPWSVSWRAWWQKAGADIDLTGLGRSEPYLGYTLVVLLDAGRVEEIDSEGKVRWQIDNLQSPLDAQVLPGDRVLIAEHRNRMVTERNFKGEVIWQYQAPFGPIAAQRLPSGATFIVGHEMLMEVDRAGKELLTIKPSGERIVTARKRPDGRIECVYGSGRCARLDAGGKEILSVAVPKSVQTTSCLFELPGGILLADYGGGRAVEFDTSGKEIWKASVASPISVFRLPNGNTLVSSQQNCILEFDRSGTEVKRIDMAGHPTRVRRR